MQEVMAAWTRGWGREEEFREIKRLKFPDDDHVEIK